MNKTLTTALALLAGFMGGVLTHYIAPPVALAQNQALTTKEIRAQSFTLVDPSDHTVGTFTYEAGPAAFVRPKTPPRIVLRDSGGRELWSAGGTAVRPLSER